MDSPSLSDGDKVLLPPSTLQEIMARVGEGGERSSAAAPRHSAALPDSASPSPPSSCRAPGMPHPMLFKLEWGGAARHVGVLPN